VWRWGVGLLVLGVLKESNAKAAEIARATAESILREPIR
jgi:hypothetical protein